MRNKVENIVLIFLLTFSISSFIEGKRDFKIVFDTCGTNIFLPENLAHVNCSLVPDPAKSDRTLLYGAIETVRNIPIFELGINLDMLRKDNTKINLMNQKVDGCKWLEGGYDHNLLRGNLKEFRRVGNFPKKCPIVGGYRYKIDGFFPDPEIYPVFLPELSFQLTIDVFEKGRKLGNLQITGRVYKK